jgi:hypothetical protein
MRKIISTLAAAAALLAAGSLANRADAMPVGDPVGIRAAIDDIAVTDQVHCRPGWWHHRFRPHDGCFFRRRVFYSPFFYHRPFFFHRRFVVHRPFFGHRPFVGARFGGGGFRGGPRFVGGGGGFRGGFGGGFRGGIGGRGRR